MGLGSKLRRTWNRATAAVRDVGKQASSNLADLEDSGGTAAALGMFANPLIAQDIMGSAFGGALARGADTRTAFTQAGQSNATILSGNNPEQWKDLAAFNAALLAGAATGGIAGGALGAGGLAPSVAALSTPAWTGAAAAGAGLAAGAAGYAGIQSARGVLDVGGNNQPGAETPPDIASMYANDPDISAQFSRMRKSARMLGRAGTIKYKGSGSSLGLGEQMLGDQMSLIGV